MSKEQQSKRVVVRAGIKVDLVILRMTDIEQLLHWFNDQEILQFLGHQRAKQEGEERQWLEQLHTKSATDQVFGIATKKGRLIGTVGLHGILDKDRVCHSGAVIGEKEYWSKGYGSEAEMLLGSYAFLTLNLRKICFTVLANNPRSLKAALKSGAIEEGRQRDQHYVQGKYVDAIILAVFKEDWLPRWEEYKKGLSK